MPQTIVAMISSNVARAGHPSRVLVQRNSATGLQMGLSTDSVIVTDNLATVLESEIDKSNGSCLIMSTVDQALRSTLAL